MKIVRTLIVESDSDRERVRRQLSTFGWAEETIVIDERRLLTKISDQAWSAVRDKEKRITELDGVNSCKVLKTQYMA